MKPMRFMLVFSLLLAMGNGHAADPSTPSVIDLCLDLKRPLHMCQCSATRLEQQSGKKDFHDYAAVSGTYLQNKRSGMRRRTAWSNALSELSKTSGEPAETLSDRLDVIAGKHRITMQQCSQQ